MTTSGITAVRVGGTDDIPELGRLVVDVGDRTIGIFRVQGRLYAYDNVCPHQGGPVCQGRVMPKVRENIDAEKKAHGMGYDRSEMHIVCPWHGAEFVIATGVHAGISTLRLTSVDVRERDGEIYVSV
ncbi:Rieske (2Fe-2S) protein [Nocardia sp. NPDC051570]|uniref:Rieske (2Fe-2S) protein n=1 Tax=Nocardia sp. NPDC051570 TaxID=3364324 RepID=UPI00379A1504